MIDRKSIGSAARGHAELVLDPGSACRLSGRDCDPPPEFRLDEHVGCCVPSVRA